MDTKIKAGVEAPQPPMTDVDPIEMPENAFRELAADETYRPVLRAIMPR